MIIMYDEIQKIICPTQLSSYDYEKLEELKKTYSEKSIIEAYKNSRIKTVNYVTKVLQDKMKKAPEWLDKVFDDEPLDEKTKEIFEDFDKFLEEFRKNE